MRKILISLVVVLAVFTMGCWGQSGSATTSIYMTLGTNVSTTPTITSNVTNVGQVGHQVIVQLSNASAHTCTFANVTVGATLQFSYDNTNWSNFGNPTPNDANNVPYTGVTAYFGAGSYPYVRFYLSSFDNTNCVAAIFYTGSTQQSALVSTNTIIGGYVGNIGSNASGGLTNINFTPIATFNNNRAYPLVQCTNPINSLGTAYTAGTYYLGMATQQVVGASQAGVGVCNIIASASAAGSFQLFRSSTADCLSPLGSVKFGPIYLPANGSFTLGNGTGLVYVINAINTSAQYVCATVTGTMYIGGMWSSL